MKQGTCPGGTIEDISYLRERALGQNQEEEARAEEKKREQDAADPEEERERPGRKKDTRCRNEGKKTQADGNTEESLKEGTQGRPNNEEINKPQFWDSTASTGRCPYSGLCWHPFKKKTSKDR
ncbi:hypothetical protein NDU88_004527 [Pleurodeles waltl]|uniref:Uncharacterized protein n=1 Tax=Pleurodeles waltl TaxID=8319 RepID=A0AAV7VIJ3_PLEWA|nr:hypothetical protein NDU88_004527 [Pleurodeles waltl]